MSQNRTFKIELDVMEHKFLETVARRDEWLWHYILGNLNFKYIINLKRINLVLGIPKFEIANKVCDDCVQEKQHKNNSNKDAEVDHILSCVWSSLGRFDWR